MFNVGLGEIVAIVLVTLLLFGPERLPEMARQAGRWLGRLRLTTQDALDQLKDEADLKDLSLPDLRIGSLRSQARDYVRELMDVEGQMAELEREREQLKAALDAEQNGGPKGTGEGAAEDATPDAAGDSTSSTADLGPPPVDPEAT
ncbi:MAG TPA: twin-arginine translocase TatA/TatE family subunit [Gemmatimonadales bacterium]|nr:twin-arginine translocase TatA/TatE family subunit [Gemmatimonadales bacterium]